MKKFFFLNLVLVLLLVFASCNENECHNTLRGVVTSVDGPTSGGVGENLVYTISFYASNGCGSFHSISSNRVGSTVFIEAKVRYKGCICPDVLVEFQKDYVFRPTEQGVYTLVFQNNVQEHITLTITIN